MGWWVWTIGIVIVVAAVSWWSGPRKRRRDQREIVRALRVCLDHDVDALETDLRRLEHSLGSRYHDPEIRRDYDLVESSIASARQSISELDNPVDAYSITETLAEGRYASACVQARIDDVPLPERRMPCFFNPQHGPSGADVPWMAYDSTEVEVPACGTDAGRIAAGERPDIREIWTGWRQVPYWSAGSSFLGYSTGYFAGDWSGSPDAIREAVDFCLVGPRVGAHGLMGDPAVGWVGDGGGGCGGGGGDGGGC